MLRVGIMGGGWPGAAHAKGYQSAGGFKLAAVADLIPSRRQKLMQEFGIQREYADAQQMLSDPQIDAVSICLPNHLHAPMAVAALKAGKHVMCEKPPGISTADAKKIAGAAAKSGKVVMYALQRRFGGAEQAARQAIARGYAGEIYHARSTWLRTRGIPLGTGWFTDKSKSGGGALIDIGVHMLDLAWFLMGQPRPISVYGVTSHRLAGLASGAAKFDVEDAAFAMIRFEGDKSLELSASWALNQAPQQNGTACRVYGTKGGVEVYTPQGAVLYRDFDKDGEAKPTALKPPKTVQHAALMRHFRECISGKAAPLAGAEQGVMLMQMLEAIYRSAESGKSVALASPTVSATGPAQSPCPAS